MRKENKKKRDDNKKRTEMNKASKGGGDLGTGDPEEAPEWGSDTVPFSD